MVHLKHMTVIALLVISTEQALLSRPEGTAQLLFKPQKSGSWTNEVEPEQQQQLEQQQQQLEQQQQQHQQQLQQEQGQKQPKTQKQDRIVGGESAVTFEFPFVAIGHPFNFVFQFKHSIHLAILLSDNHIISDDLCHIVEFSFSHIVGFFHAITHRLGLDVGDFI
eukprot:c12816_g3_i1.p1 GENE.c12816_g3_i1~~c12816_g3_i1.p1  ORF type:complete len:181 (+),score=57.57 c12816_g3_i1:51-545(+)